MTAAVLIFSGMLGLFSSLIYFYISYRNKSIENKHVILEIEKLENEFLADFSQANLIELKETTAGRKLLELLRNYEISPSKLSYRKSSLKVNAESSQQEKVNIGENSEIAMIENLETVARGKDNNWKISIADMLKLLDIDSSREAREELMKELNLPIELMQDSAKMNAWLHKALLKKIAENDKRKFPFPHHRNT